MGENRSKKNGGGDKKNGGEIVQKEGEGAKFVIRIVGDRVEAVLSLPVPRKDGKGKGDAGAREEKKRQDGKGKGDAGAREGKKRQDGKGKGDAGAGEGKKRQEKEPPITTAVLKVHLPCQECIEDFFKVLTKFKGYKDMKIVKEKHLWTVTGSMDNINDLAAKLKKHLKKVEIKVEIVPPKKKGRDKKEKAKGRER